MKQYIKEIKDQGKTIVLDNSSTWEVDMFDRLDTALWMRLDNVTVNGNKMINHNQRDKTVGIKKVN